MPSASPRILSHLLHDIIICCLMARTPLYEQLAASGADFAEYCGAETARSFGDPRTEYHALVSAAGVYDLGWRAKIVLTGSDRVRWTNGMVTNNVRDLPQDHGNYNFILNPQGRIQGDLYVYNFGDHLLVDTELWQAARLKDIFDKFIIMDDVEVADISDKLTGIAVQGPQALSILRSVGITIADDVEPLVVTRSVWQDIGISVTRMASDIAKTTKSGSPPRTRPSYGMLLLPPEPSPLAPTPSKFSVWPPVSLVTDRTFANAIFRRRPARVRPSISPRDATLARRLSSASILAATYTASSLDS